MVVSGWVVEFLLRQPDIPDPILNHILTNIIIIHLHHHPPTFSLYNSLLLRRLQSETTVSQNILDLLELIEELRHVAGVPVTESMRTAYRLVAEECGVWSDRVGGMMGGGGGDPCGLVTEEERERWVRENGDGIAMGEKRRKENGDGIGEEKDVMGAVRAYVAEAWEELGPSFLEVVAGVFGVVELEETKVSHLPRRKIVAKKFSRGAKITGTEQIKNRDLLKRYDCVSTPAYDKLQEALTTSSLELHDVVKDPLPEALQCAERVISSSKKDNMAPTNNASKPSIMLRNSTACTDEVIYV